MILFNLKVQIFEKLLNACTRERISLTTALLIPTLQMMFFLAAMKFFHSGQDFMAVMFLWAYLLALSFTLLTFSAAAMIYGASQKWILKSKGGDRKKWDRKFHQSLIPLRLQFGNNFVEVQTPLVGRNFACGK